MKNNYRRTKTTVSLINYHLVFCPRYRRKIFNIPGVEDRFKELASEACKNHGIEILTMECHIDHVHMFVSTPPNVSAGDVIKFIKGNTAHKLMNEFPVLSAMPTVWTRSYFASTAGDVSSETIEWYVKTQKTRP